MNKDRVCTLSSDGKMGCWDQDGIEIAVPPGYDYGVKDLTVGSDHVCAVDKRGRLKCWLLDV